MTTRERMDERSLADRLQGKWLAFVYDRNDPIPTKKRVRAIIPRLGDYITDWALPCGVHSASHEIPEVGEMVWIEFESGNPQIAIW